MLKLVLLRHGQSQWNLENRFTGWTDVDLTAQGIEEANNAGLDDKTDRGHINNLYFNGNSTTFNNSSTPNSKNIAGSATNISITGVSNKATNMTFTVDIP